MNEKEKRKFIAELKSLKSNTELCKTQFGEGTIVMIRWEFIENIIKKWEEK